MPLPTFYPAFMAHAIRHGSAHQAYAARALVNAAKEAIYTTHAPELVGYLVSWIAAVATA